MDRTRSLAVIAEAGARITDAASSPGVPVVSCPPWSVADLVWHVGVVQDFWRRLVDGSLSSPGDFHPGERPGDGALAGWYRSTLEGLTTVLAGADPAQPVWTWAQDHTAGFVQRRMAHELAVHAWDADDALGRSGPIAADTAVDGIDELFEAFLFRVPFGDRFAAGDALHLHSTDPAGDGSGEWLLQASDGAWMVERRHAKGAFALQAPASDLLLALWGRVPIDGLRSFGDRAVFDELVEGLRASMGGRPAP